MAMCQKEKFALNDRNILWGDLEKEDFDNLALVYFVTPSPQKQRKIEMQNH